MKLGDRLKAADTQDSAMHPSQPRPRGVSYKNMPQTRTHTLNPQREAFFFFSDDRVNFVPLKVKSLDVLHVAGEWPSRVAVRRRTQA